MGMLRRTRLFGSDASVGSISPQCESGTLGNLCHTPVCGRQDISRGRSLGTMHEADEGALQPLAVCIADQGSQHRVSCQWLCHSHVAVMLPDVCMLQVGNEPEHSLARYGKGHNITADHQRIARSASLAAQGPTHDMSCQERAATISCPTICLHAPLHAPLHVCSLLVDSQSIESLGWTRQSHSFQRAQSRPTVTGGTG